MSSPPSCIPERILPTTVEFVDIAGLVAGASKGEGLGNKFLAHIREVDAIAHVVRCFENDDIMHVAGKIDPASDIEVINTELALADLDSVEARLSEGGEGGQGRGQGGGRTRDLLERVREQLNGAGRCARWASMPTSGRCCAICTSSPTSRSCTWPTSMRTGFDEQSAARSRARAREGARAQWWCRCARPSRRRSRSSRRPTARNSCRNSELEEPGLNRVIRGGYALLGLQTYFTAGVKEVRAWTVHAGATAPQAAGVIHTDFEKGFIRAEVIAYEDFIACKGEAGAKEAGKLRLEGKEYIVREGDVMHFRFNV